MEGLLRQILIHGRAYRERKDEQEFWEFKRLFGKLLHTIEDWPAHSNLVSSMKCKNHYLTCYQVELIAHYRMGMSYDTVYPFVGRDALHRVNFNTIHGQKLVYPLVTGTFAGTDFFVSLLGEIQSKVGEVVSTKDKTIIFAAVKKIAHLSSHRGI
jgi:hypothetical protein